MRVLFDFPCARSPIVCHGRRQPTWRHGLVFAAVCLFASAAHALGLDAIRLQSGLGQPLRAQIALLGTDADDIRAACVKARLESSDGAFIGMLQVAIRNGSPATLQLSSHQNIDEPAVNVLLEVHCAGAIRRSYPLLLDPPALLPEIVAASLQIAAPAVGRSQPATSMAHADTGRNKPSAATGGLRSGRATDGMHAEQALPASDIPVRKAGKMPRAKGKYPARSVLQLAAADAPATENEADFRLKLSDTLSGAPLASEPGSRDALRSARAQLAAAMRGEDAAQNADRQIRTLQEQLQALQAETARLARQRQADQHALEEIRRQSFSSGWIATLGGLLLLSLAASAWLLRRAHGSGSLRRAPWWEHTESAVRTDDAEVPPASATIFPAREEVAQPEKDAEQSSASSAPADGVPEAAMACGALPARSADGAAGDLPFYSRRSNGLKAEEITDGMEEAEFWMLLNVPERAIEILEQYNNGDRPSSPQPWLCLLDLYREVGNEKKYTELLHRFAGQFNVIVPEWNECVAAEKQHSLEDFPHLIERICALWHTENIVPFLERLLYDDRDGVRTGFDMPAYRELMLLADMAHELEQDGQSAKPASVSSG